MYRSKQIEMNYTKFLGKFGVLMIIIITNVSRKHKMYLKQS